MTREEVQDYLAMMQAAYPNYNPPSRTAAVNVWTMALAEYDKEDVAIAFKFYLQTNSSGFAPSVGQLIDKIYDMKNPQELNEQEAWSLVANAIRNSGYHSVEEFAKLPLTVQKAVGQSSQLKEWATSEKINLEVAMSSFQRAYRCEVAKKRELGKVSSDLRRAIDCVSQNSPKSQIEKKNNDVIKSSKEQLESESKYVPMPRWMEEKLNYK